MTSESLSFSLAPAISRRRLRAGASSFRSQLAKESVDEARDCDAVFEHENREDGTSKKNIKYIDTVTEEDTKDLSEKGEGPQFEFDDFGVGESAKDRIARLVRRRKELSGGNENEVELFRRDVEACAEDESAESRSESRIVEGFGAAMLKAMGWDGKTTKTKEAVAKIGRKGLGARAGDLDRMIEKETGTRECGKGSPRQGEVEGDGSGTTREDRNGMRSRYGREGSERGDLCGRIRSSENRYNFHASRDGRGAARCTGSQAYREHSPKKRPRFASGSRTDRGEHLQRYERDELNKEPRHSRRCDDRSGSRSHSRYLEDRNGLQESGSARSGYVSDRKYHRSHVGADMRYGDYNQSYRRDRSNARHRMSHFRMGECNDEQRLKRQKR